MHELLESKPEGGAIKVRVLMGDVIKSTWIMENISKSESELDGHL